MCDQCIEWGGKRWHRYDGGYYERTDKSTRPKLTRRLHREMWIDAHGPIPPGFDVHHSDEDKGHNDLGNFELLQKGAHMRHHRKTKPIPKKDWAAPATLIFECVGCSTPLARKRKTVNPICKQCANREAEERRKKPVRCQQCGTEFMSRFGNYCGQRCVNLATHGGTRSVLPDCRRVA